MSFQIALSSNRRAAGRFVGKVRRRLQRAFAENPEVTQTAIADSLGVHRSVINRQLRGHADMTLGRVAELAWALGFEPEFDLIKIEAQAGENEAPPIPGARVLGKSPVTASSAVTIPAKELQWATV